MEQVFEIAEYSIFTRTEGEGRPLLLLHSFWGSHILFERLTKAISGKRRIIRIDLPGHGKSGNPPADYTFDNFAPIINEIFTRLNVKGQFSIIGHSMGGYAALAFAAKFPGRIESMVLMHTPIKAADIHSIKLRERESGLLLKGKKELLLQVSIPSNFAPENSCSMVSTAELLMKISNEVTIEGALRSIHAINHRGNSLGVLQSARYPVLIIIGKYDKVYSSDEQLDEVSQIPNSEVLVLNHSGHLGFLEEEDLVTKKIGEFLI